MTRVTLFSNGLRPSIVFFQSLARAVALVVPHQSTVPPPLARSLMNSMTIPFPLPRRFPPLRFSHTTVGKPPPSSSSSSFLLVFNGLTIMFLRVNISVKPQPFRRLLLKARVFRSIGYKNKLALRTLTHTF